jgi:hypothetical protein
MASSSERSIKSYHRRRAVQAENAAAGREESRSAINTELVDFIGKCQKSPSFFIEACLSVAPMEGGEIVPFRLNPGQKRVMDVVERQMAEGRPVRVIVLKSRRQGISTLCQALGYWRTSLFPFTNGMVVAHKRENTSEIFRMTKLFYDSDERSKLGVRPSVINSNEQAIRFDVDRRAKERGEKGLTSNLLVESSEGTGVAVGLTLQFLHASETAKWTNSIIMAGLGIALTKTQGSMGLMESTAEGVGNVFEKTWTAAANGKNDWEPVFLPWSIDPRCVYPVNQAEREQWDFADKTEFEIYEKHNLSLEQLKWRRIQLASPDMIRPGVKPEAVFAQEYPLTPEEAFLTTGQSFFLSDALKTLETSGKGTKKHIYRAILPLNGIPSERRGRDPIVVAPVKDEYGELTVWEDPVPGEDYVIGADVAQGLEHRDYSVAWVLRRSNLRFVARIKGNKFDADEFGQKCCLLGWRYNTALLGPEINGPGVAAVAAIRRLRYSRVWFDRDILKTGEPVSKYIGWRTTSANRRSVLERLEEEIRRLTIDMPASEFYEEARVFQLIDGKPQAMAGRHDDEIMSSAIALQLHILGGAMRDHSEKSRPVLRPAFDPVRPVATTVKKKLTISALEWF